MARIKHAPSLEEPTAQRGGHRTEINEYQSAFPCNCNDTLPLLSFSLFIDATKLLSTGIRNHSLEHAIQIGCQWNGKWTIRQCLGFAEQKLQNGAARISGPFVRRASSCEKWVQTNMFSDESHGRIWTLDPRCYSESTPSWRQALLKPVSYFLSQYRPTSLNCTTVPRCSNGCTTQRTADLREARCWF